MFILNQPLLLLLNFWVLNHSIIIIIIINIITLRDEIRYTKNSFNITNGQGTNM